MSNYIGKMRAWHSLTSSYIYWNITQTMDPLSELPITYPPLNQLSDFTLVEIKSPIALMPVGIPEDGYVPTWSAADGYYIPKVQTGTGGSAIPAGTNPDQILQYNGSAWVSQNDLTLYGDNNRTIKVDTSTAVDGYYLSILGSDAGAGGIGGGILVKGGDSGVGTSIQGGGIIISGGRGRGPGGTFSPLYFGDIYLQYYNPGHTPQPANAVLIGDSNDGYYHAAIYVPRSGNINIGLSNISFYASGTGGTTKTIGIEANANIGAGDHLNIVSGAANGLGAGGNLIIDTGVGAGGGGYGDIQIGTNAARTSLGGTIASTYQMLFNPTANTITIGMNDTLKCDVNGMIDLPSLFKINNSAVSGNVTAVNLTELTGGGETTLHSHAGGGAATVTHPTISGDIATGDYCVAAAPAFGSITLNLPPAPTEGEQHIIKDATGVAAAWNIIINGNGHNIDSAASYTISANWTSISLMYTGTVWSIL